MKELKKYLLAGYYLFFSTVNINAQQDVSRRAGYVPRIRTIDIKHIDISLHFDWLNKQAIGTAAITFSPLNSCDNISLDAGWLDIHSITLADKSPLRFNYQGGDKNDNLEIVLDRKYYAGEVVRIIIDYHSKYSNESDPNNLGGSYGKGLRFFRPTYTDPRKRMQIWSAGMPESNRYWFPGYDAPDDFRTTAFTATVDKRMTVISNGVLTNVTANADGTRSFHWEMNKPYANHQTSFVVGEYADLKQEFNGIDIHNYSYPDETAAVKASTERLTSMIRFFSDKTGCPFPYSRYNQVFVQEFPWGGGHNMNTSTLSDNMIDDYETHRDFIYLWDWVEGNDLAAQWFGNLLTPESWEHSWLNKSFAAYFSTLYNEHMNGFDEFQLYSRAAVDLPAIISDWDAGLRRPLVTSLYDDPNTMLNDNIAMSRGPQVLHMLRKYLGEEKWWKAINIYLETNAGKTVTTRDFQDAVNRAAGENTDWFFDQWVYKTGLPVFDVSKTYDTARRILVLTVKQVKSSDTGSLYPQTVYFRGKINIAIDNVVREIWIEAKPENIFQLPVSSPPKLLNFDYQSTWIKKITFTKSLEELLYQLMQDKDILGRTDALEQLFAIAKNDATAGTDRQKIITAFQSLLSTRLYWRFRQNVLMKLRSVLPLPYDRKMITLLQNLIQNESGWFRGSAIAVLGNTKDARFASLYNSYLNDRSDRVVFPAAMALAKTKSAGAFDTLKQLISRPSWKNQSLLSALTAMKMLGDERALPLALDALRDSPPKPRWTLANNSWDYRVVAAETLAAFGKGHEGFPVVLDRFRKSMEENDNNDIFNNVMLTAILGDPAGQQVFDLVRFRFMDDLNAMNAIRQYEEQFKQALKK